jgi:AraC family transcriptional regulator
MKTNFEYVQQVIDDFEDSLVKGPPITSSAELAGRVGYSSHHLGALFQSLCKESLGRYILRRRLSHAAVLIRDQRAHPTEVFTLLGWADYSSFARAVKKEFGVSPSSLVDLDSRDVSLAVRARPSLGDPKKQSIMEPLLIQATPLHLTGLVFFMDRNQKSFHKPWRIFEKNRQRIHAINGPDVFQYTFWDDDASPEDDGLFLLCALQTEQGVEQEPLFFSKSTPAQKVLCFRHEGPVETIHDTYQRIFNDFLPASTYRLAGSFEYQRYEEDGGIRICLPVC